MISPDVNAQIPETIGKAHFIGIGGSGMSGIARMFLGQGVKVSGSDRSGNYATDQLLELGADVRIGHAAENLADDVDTVVVTSALWPDNPELVLAKERGLNILHRSQALVWLTRGSRVISVAGAHGKTTSTGMIASALLELGADPSFVNGGVIQSLGTNEHDGQDVEFIVEADESDGSFLFYDTAIALITNIDNDHLDHYGTAEAFDAAFRAFADRASEAVIISSDDPQAVALTPTLSHENIMTFGEAETADVRVSDIAPTGTGVRFTITARGESADGELSVPGHHNALNAAGAVSVLLMLGYGLQESVAALHAFGGTKRRFDLQGVVGGVSVYDDYAHHPAEVEAALSAARTVVGEGRIIAVHQPHLYSRTQAMSDEFAEVYERLADHTIVLDVDGAREDPVPGVTGEYVTREFKNAELVEYQPEWPNAAAAAAAWAQPGDFIITLGCGNVYRIVPQLLEALEDTGEDA
ncbi:UDP-N-acetylmuramate--L-alanine ligase [Gulosibacter molinativorax]|uniref:UDP-N-acetylmuramate--L-alanine ligase n=1 Tax=Gulosibacter molinativorax TaxID=256821 RepID=A0ABT7C5D7_9MICO|nr:UDP-N-acetylmuramate--L-alanine ligase [Gulosibacter molinativorax]MDJ1370399.1 UDP-N-acetylmuramate--L-alanine ligase [Gulosibacter molinativorax]QUY61312.1 UDP-N-acetylmuramate--L-alanine ligase [Gulosibacter molinativorax]